MTIDPRIDRAYAREMEKAQSTSDRRVAFAHLERAHVIGQSSTVLHVRAHWAMLRWGLAGGDYREIAGQMLRLVGAATKTAFGLVPLGNTGGSNVSPFKRMPVPSDLQYLLEKVSDNEK